MTPEDPKSARETPAHTTTGSDPKLVWWAVAVGLVCAVVGAVDGLLMALKRKEGACPDETTFPEGATDFTCYVHPQGGLGIALVALSVLLGIIVVLAGIAAHASMERSRQT